MEGLANLVSESLARHGLETSLDHARLRWSRWFRCESSFSFLLVPSQPGLFALGEEMIPPGELPATGGKRMLGLFQISEAEDLGSEMGRMFAPHHPLRERIGSGRCFARYVVVQDGDERRNAAETLKRWLASSTETASGISADFAAESTGPLVAQLPGSGTGGVEMRRGAGAAVSNQQDVGSRLAASSRLARQQEASATIQPAPLPSGF
jgi:hypothetical protein